MSKLDKYQKWLKDISDEVLGLTFSLDVWKQVIEIENNSKYFKKWGGHFQHWQNQNYTYRMVITLGKITAPCTRNKDDRNFIKLLEQLKIQNYISFDKFIKTYSLPPVEKPKRKIIEYIGEGAIYEMTRTIEDAQNDFEEITGCSYMEKDFSKMIDKDIEEIKQIFNKIKKLRHKKLAHMTDTTVREVPTYEDIEKSIEQLQVLVKKYYLILFNTHQTFHYYDLNVKTVFEEAWIKNT